MVADVSAAGQALITVVTPLHLPGSANVAASVCLCRKQERSLFTAALEQTSNVPTTRNVGRLSGRIRRGPVAFLYPGASR